MVKSAKEKVKYLNDNNHKNTTLLIQIMSKFKLVNIDTCICS
jgi:hypothetical protein